MTPLRAWATFMRAWWEWSVDLVAELVPDEERRGRARPNKVDLAMKVERALCARYLRERAVMYRTTSQAVHDALMSASNHIAGGMHYR